MYKSLCFDKMNALCDFKMFLTFIDFSTKMLDNDRKGGVIMAVLTRTTEIIIRDEEKLIALLSAKPNPSKEAFERVQKAKSHPLFKGTDLSDTIN